MKTTTTFYLMETKTLCDRSPDELFLVRARERHLLLLQDRVRIMLEECLLRSGLKTVRLCLLRLHRRSHCLSHLNLNRMIRYQ